MVKAFDFLFEIFSFSSKYRRYIFILILVLLFVVPVNFIENEMPNLSLCSKVLGKYCYSVGITRGTASLLKGDFYRAWDYNPISFLVAAGLISFIICDFSRRTDKK